MPFHVFCTHCTCALPMFVVEVFRSALLRMHNGGVVFHMPFFVMKTSKDFVHRDRENHFCFSKKTDKNVNIWHNFRVNFFIEYATDDSTQGAHIAEHYQLKVAKLNICEIMNNKHYWKNTLRTCLPKRLHRQKCSQEGAT